jgi:hypothetical protein
MIPKTPPRTTWSSNDPRSADAFLSPKYAELRERWAKEIREQAQKDFDERLLAGLGLDPAACIQTPSDLDR